jgi:hypothetical protein
VARWFRVPWLRPCGSVADGRWSVQVRRLRPPHVGDGRDDLRPDADPADGAVPGLLAVCHRQGRVSALSLQRALEIGSYQTAWAMLHRLRSVLVCPDRDRLAGMVEVDETYIGGEEPGLRGGRARGKKILTCIAVEIHEPKGLGLAGQVGERAVP